MAFKWKYLVKNNWGKKMQATNQQSEGIKVHQPTNLASTTLWVFSKLNAEICWTWTSWEARASFESRYSIHWSRRKLRHKKWRQEKLKMFSSLVPFFQVPGLFTIATNKSKLFQNRSRSNFPIYKIGWKFTTLTTRPRLVTGFNLPNILWFHSLLLCQRLDAAVSPRLCGLLSELFQIN